MRISGAETHHSLDTMRHPFFDRMHVFCYVVCIDLDWQFLDLKWGMIVVAWIPHSSFFVTRCLYRLPNAATFHTYHECVLEGRSCQGLQCMLYVAPDARDV